MKIYFLSLFFSGINIVAAAMLSSKTGPGRYLPYPFSVDSS